MDVLQTQRDYTRTEAVDIALTAVVRGIARAKAEDDWQTVQDGRRLCDTWLDRRLVARDE